MTTEENEQEYKVTRGIPGSGKSTYAMKWVAQDPANRVRVSRDDIRLSLFGKYVVLDRKGKIDGNAEAQVSIVEESQLRKALNAKKSVISDKTNINQKDIDNHQALAKEYGVKISHKDFPITLEEAKRRNSLRDRVVEEFVIERMYKNLGPNGQFHHFDGDYTPRAFVKPATKETGIIVDLDGTLVDVRSIRHYVRSKYKNFDMFHRSSLFCPPNPEVLDMVVDAHEAGFPIVIVSARQERYREVSEVWLNKHLPVPFSNMYLRPQEDNRPDFLVKHDILKKIREDYNIAVAIDDNPNVRDNWTQNGIRTVVVAGFEEGEVGETEVIRINNSFRSGGCLRCGKPLKSGAAIGPVCAKF